MNSIAEILGVLGVGAITIAYLLLSQGKLKAHEWQYPFINFLGASGIVVSLLVDWNLSAFMMEATWAAISFYGWIRALRVKSQKQPSLF